MPELVTQLKTLISDALSELGAPDIEFSVEHPADPAHGDYATNAALVAAKRLGTLPRTLAGEIASKIQARSIPDVADITVAGAGFINFRLDDRVFVRTLTDALALGADWGKSDRFSGKRVVIEYTDPNPFKEFHIGHLLPNTIGESLARLVAFGGGDVKRVNYQGDVGMHIAMAIWGIEHSHENMPHEDAQPRMKAQFLGSAYAKGAKAFAEDPKVKEAITAINKKIYSRTDPLVNALYDNGKRWSLEYFESIYAILGTTFDHYFFESETGPIGREIVLANMDSVFVKSDGAVVFPGESYGLHTRVFINSEGLPTYEAKELGLAKIKYDLFPYDLSVIVTANEITDYFAVLLKVMSLVYEEEGLAGKTKHVAHGVLRLESGKLSSRAGNVITALSLIEDAKEVVRGKIADDRGFDASEREVIAQAVAVGAIKYAILRQEVGRDMVFDFSTSLAFDGDSGPYLAYTLARLTSLLEKAQTSGIAPDTMRPMTPGELERTLARFPEVIERAQEYFSPHHLANYLITLAHAFNAYYAKTVIVDDTSDAPYKVALASAVRVTMDNGLALLGIPAPKRM